MRRNSIYKELEHVLDRFPKYHMRILLRDFHAKLGAEYIFKLTLGNESLHEITRNKNEIRAIELTTSKNCQENNIPTSQHALIDLDFS